MYLFRSLAPHFGFVRLGSTIPHSSQKKRLNSSSRRYGFQRLSEVLLLACHPGHQWKELHNQHFHCRGECFAVVHHRLWQRIRDLRNLEAAPHPPASVQHPPVLPRVCGLHSRDNCSANSRHLQSHGTEQSAVPLLLCRQDRAVILRLVNRRCVPSYSVRHKCGQISRLEASYALRSGRYFYPSLETRRRPLVVYRVSRFGSVFRGSTHLVGCRVAYPVGQHRSYSSFVLQSFPNNPSSSPTDPSARPASAILPREKRCGSRQTQTISSDHDVCSRNLHLVLLALLRHHFRWKDPGLLDGSEDRLRFVDYRCVPVVNNWPFSLLLENKRDSTKSPWDVQKDWPASNYSLKVKIPAGTHTKK